MKTSRTISLRYLIVASMAALSASILGTYNAEAQTEVHVYVRAFIPKEHPGNPGLLDPFRVMSGSL